MFYKYNWHKKVLSVHYLYKNKHLDVCKHSDLELNVFSYFLPDVQGHKNRYLRSDGIKTKTNSIHILHFYGCLKHIHASNLNYIFSLCPILNILYLSWILLLRKGLFANNLRSFGKKTTQIMGENEEILDGIKMRNERFE